MEQSTVISMLEIIIKEKLQIELSQHLQATDRIFEDLHIDSIVVLQLMVYIEEAFEISIPEEDVDASVFKTVGSLAVFIQELQNEKNTSKSPLL